MKNKAVDDYIKRSAPFAQPVLEYFRSLVHTACPGAEEKIKWGFPHFDYKGVYVSMAAFKAHCAFTFWKAKEMEDPEGLFTGQQAKAMGQLGRIASLDDLPAKEVLLSYLVHARDLNDRGVKRQTTRPTPKEQRQLTVPDDLLGELERHPDALRIFENLPYSHKKEYINWINEAKTDPTRQKRIRKTVELSAEGKDRNGNSRRSGV